ncbi:TPA: hypothetical protein M4196_002132 [Klebsiella variicola]|nr:hypothetical protein [Klebsiella variicola]HDK6407032.1 hypothetical protein [Klebsiella variicola]
MKNRAAENNVITEPSLITAKRLTAHKIVVKETGEVIRMTNDHRMVYSHLEDQFRSLTNTENIAAGKSTGHYYDSDENLAIRCDVKNTTFKKVKKDLKALGLIRWITPKAKKSGHSCEYFVKSVKEVALNLEFIFQELPNGKPSYDHERVSGQKTNKSKPQAPQAESANQPADTPTGQSADVAPESSPFVAGQRDSVESDNDNDNGSDDRAAGNHEVRQKQKQDPFPWRGDTFIKKRLSENAYQWAITMGATDWRHACRLVWEKAELTQPTEFDEHFKPLSLC